MLYYYRQYIYIDSIVMSQGYYFKKTASNKDIERKTCIKKLNL